jgi:hypothetical protein
MLAPLQLPQDDPRPTPQPMTAKDRRIEAVLLTFGVIYGLGFWILTGLYLWRCIGAVFHQTMP